MRTFEPPVNPKDRDSVIRWLVWADPNGCHTDEDCILEGLPIHTLETALICRRDISQRD